MEVRKAENLTDVHADKTKKTSMDRVVTGTSTWMIKKTRSLSFNECIRIHAHQEFEKAARYCKKTVKTPRMNWLKLCTSNQSINLQSWGWSATRNSVINQWINRSPEGYGVCFRVLVFHPTSYKNLLMPKQHLSWLITRMEENYARYPSCAAMRPSWWPLCLFVTARR